MQLQVWSFYCDQQRSLEHMQQALLMPEFLHKIPPNLFLNGQEPKQNNFYILN